jgi:hypothetical protein
MQRCCSSSRHVCRHQLHLGQNSHNPLSILQHDLRQLAQSFGNAQKIVMLRAKNQVWCVHILEWSWDSVKGWHLGDSHNDCHEGRIVIHKSWLGWTSWPQNCCALWMNTFYNLGRNWTPCLVWGSSRVSSDVNCVSCRLFYKCRMFLLRSMLCSTTQQFNQVFGKLLWEGLSTHLSFGFLISVCSGDKALLCCLGGTGAFASMAQMHEFSLALVMR